MKLLDFYLVCSKELYFYLFNRGLDRSCNSFLTGCLVFRTESRYSVEPVSSCLLWPCGLRQQGAAVALVPLLDVTVNILILIIIRNKQKKLLIIVQAAIIPLLAN